MEPCITQFFLSVNATAAVFCYTVLNTSWLDLVSVKESKKEVKYAHIYTYIYFLKILKPHQ